DSRLRDIEDCEVAVSCPNRVINQSGCPGAYINDRSRSVTSRAFNQGKRRLQMRTEPTHLIWGFGAIDLFPMRPSVHFFRQFNARDEEYAIAVPEMPPPRSPVQSVARARAKLCRPTRTSSFATVRRAAR